MFNSTLSLIRYPGALTGKKGGFLVFICESGIPVTVFHSWSEFCRQTELRGCTNAQQRENKTNQDIFFISDRLSCFSTVGGYF